MQFGARAGEAGLQNSILFPKERDQVGLLTVEPAAQRRDQQLEREHAEVYATAVDPAVGHYALIH